MPLLDSIAEIRAGVTLRGRDATRPTPEGALHFLRIGDISRDGRIARDRIIRINPAETISPDQLLRKGDVLVASRGGRNTAAAFQLDLPDAIAGAQFFVVQPRSIVLPEFLAWYLRSEPARKHFDNRRKGTYVQLIRRADLAEIDVPIPPVEVQRAVVAFSELAEQEHSLSSRLAELRSAFHSQLLLKKIRANR